MKKIVIFGLLFATIVGCKKNETAFVDPLLTNRDTTVNPADDFFSYANGGWFKKHPIPSTEKSNGIFRMIQDTINNQIKNICENSAKANAETGSNKQKIGDFYASGMDSIAINKAGISPLKNELATIDAIKDIPSLLATISHLHTIGASPAFSFYVSQDDKNSEKNALFFGQGGLGLGERDYYFNTDAETQNIRNEYLKHVQRIFELTGVEKELASKNAQTIMKLETELAKNSRKMEALRDPIKNYNKMSVSQFSNTTPAIDWNVMLQNLKIKNADSVIVGQPEFYKALNNTLKNYSIADWKTYLKWDLVNTYAAYLNKDIENQNFAFFSTVMNGIKTQKPRWKRIVEQTDSSLGELIGASIYRRIFTKRNKRKTIRNRKQY
jgi:putative endopeptidase